jgi:CRISPR-associated protein Cas1
MAATCRSIAVSSSSQDREEVGRIPLDDVHAVLLHAHGTTWSANLITALAERGAPVGMRRQPCPRGDDFAPGRPSCSKRTISGAMERFRSIDQAWRQLVSAKIVMQGAVLWREVAGAEAFR